MSTRPIITPAILEASFDAIQSALRRVAGVASAVQIDVVDGVYAPGATWPFFTEDGGEEAALPEKRLTEKAECLYEVRVPFELDLMITGPEDTLGVWLMTDAKRFIIHRGSTKFISYCVNRIKEDGREVYLGLTSGDTLDGVASVLELVDGVQCMGITELGKQGEPYDERIEPLVAAIREAHPSLPIQVDGGVSPQTLPRLMEAGATRFAVGSALFTGDVENNFKNLQECAEGVYQ